MASRSGRCLCGAVSFVASQAPDVYGACHCEMCRRWTGGALFGLSVPADALQITGQQHIARIQSSDWAERAWCSECGSGLWYRVTLKGGPGHGVYEIPVGLLDDTAGLELEREIFSDQSLTGLHLQGEHPRLTRAQTLAMYGVELD